MVGFDFDFAAGVVGVLSNGTAGVDDEVATKDCVRELESGSFVVWWKNEVEPLFWLSADDVVVGVIVPLMICCCCLLFVDVKVPTISKPATVSSFGGVVE